MFSVMAKEMKKALEQRGKNNMAEVALFAETLLKRMEKSKSTKRKGGDKDLEPQGKNLIDEEFYIVDNCHKVVGWKIRNLLLLINGDLGTYWKQGTWGQGGSNAGYKPVPDPSLPPVSESEDDPGRLCRHRHDGS